MVERCILLKTFEELREVVSIRSEAVGGSFMEPVGARIVGLILYLSRDKGKGA
jgi:hypothetical protein